MNSALFRRLAATLCLAALAACSGSNGGALIGSSDQAAKSNSRPAGSCAAPIFNNFFGPPSAIYLAGGGWPVNGIGAPPSVGGGIAVAMKFVNPPPPETLCLIQVALSYNGVGINQVKVALYSSDPKTGNVGKLVPGAVWSPIKGLPAYGTCCVVQSLVPRKGVVINIPAGAFWLAAFAPNADKTRAATQDKWNYCNPPASGNCNGPVSTWNGKKWTMVPSVRAQGAFAVYPN